MSIRKISQVTGYSVATVSRALRGYARVKAETLKKILDAAHDVGYTPNPFVGQMMSSLRRKGASTFRGNLAFLFRGDIPGFQSDERTKLIIDSAKNRADQLGFSLDLFDVAQHKPESLVKILKHRGIQGIIVFVPSFSGRKARVKLDISSFCSVGIGWGLWHPQLDLILANYAEAQRLFIHHAHHKFQSGIAAIWDFRTDSAAHHSARGAFLASHPSGPGNAEHLFISNEKLTEKDFSRIYKKYNIRCVSFGSNVTPPVWMTNYVPMENWVFNCNPGDVPHFGRIDPQNQLVGEWGVNLLASKIHLSIVGIPENRQKLLVPPKWIPGPNFK